jgi:hypothetical protein
MAPEDLVMETWTHLGISKIPGGTEGMSGICGLLASGSSVNLLFKKPNFMPSALFCWLLIT